ncbi:hypothetical protein P869_02465 [Ligilactobacillus ruminis S23]|nr:hypothetical protein P869_02465 [Ligilactobacillus ruminis S23]
MATFLLILSFFCFKMQSLNRLCQFKRILSNVDDKSLLIGETSGFF